ncbi:MAG: DUF1295 domain-containing protein [Parvularculaceae bacterium]|nr:DUF1295 domain-containing protein [Parvularculaceae bacterium]
MIADALALALTNYAALLVAFALLWGVSWRIRDASIVDIAWGPACALPGLLTLARIDGADPRAVLLAACSSVWAARLAFHLARRNIGHGEDPRYRVMRARRRSDADFAWWSLVWVFGLQATIAWFVSLPLQVGQFGPDRPLGPLAYGGVAIFALGLAFEAVGDAQLAAWKRDPQNAGKLMRSGLWSWTRHPNYFGDCCVWSGLALIALEGPVGWLGAVSPFVMGYFLYFVSGKALLERGMRKRYKDYAAYEATVSGFFPLPPRTPPIDPTAKK